MAVTKKVADELVKKYGYTRNSDGSLTSRFGRKTQVLGESVKVTGYSSSPDKSAQIWKLSDGSEHRSGGGSYVDKPVTTAQGVTVKDYSDRYKIISGEEYTKITGRPATGQTVVFDAITGGAQSAYNNPSQAKASAQWLNSAPRYVDAKRAELNNVLNVVERYKPPQKTTASPPKVQSPSSSSSSLPSSSPPSSSTSNLQLGPGQVAPIGTVPQTVTQQVTPPVYSNQPQVTTPGGQDTGTFSSPLQTAGLSAVPQQVTYKTQYAGTPGNVPEELAPQTTGVRIVNYVNQFGSTIPVTEVNGVPQTPVPPGYVRQAQGEATQAVPTPQPITGMAEGGDVKEPETPATPPNPALESLRQAQQNLVGQAAQPIRQSVVAPLVSQPGQYIPVDAGQTVPIAPFAEAATIGTVEQANLPQVQQAAQTQAATSSDQMQQLTQQSQAAQGAVSPDAMVQAAQQGETAVSQLEAAQGTAFMMNNPVQREIQQGELISGSAVDAAKVSAVNEQVQAATASPSQKATVQGQLEDLMQQFEGGNTPAWAAASMRNAQAVLAERGLGASSLAGQAVIQATMESAFPIAQADAQTRAQFEAQNLSNRQQAAMVAAEQRARFLGQEFDQEFQSRVQNSARIADIANRNFTAEQQVALENSRAANTMNLNNLSNRQALVMSEAAALAQLDTQNLNNRQQAAVQNAQNFLQMDMQNLNNEQQMAMFDSQQLSQALFSDQAAENASRQFNASSENQTNQFFANLSQQTSQFNAAQRNALDQFNVSEVNALREFNSEIQQQRDIFNAQNGLVIAQANAQWRQNLDTLNTQAQNEANMQFSKTLNDLSAGTLDEIWQRERDLMSFAFQTAENSQDRYTELLIADKKFETEQILQAQELSAADKYGKGQIFGSIVGEVVPGLVGKIFGF